MMQLTEILNSFGGWLVGHLWRLSLELTILAAVVLAVIHLLRIKSPRLRHLFWGLVLAKPVMTLLVASPVSLYWFLHPPTPPPAAPPAPTTEMRRVRTEFSRPYRAMAVRPVRQASAAGAAPSAWWKQLNGHGVAALAWLLVASGLGLRLVVGFAFVRFLRHTATPQRQGPLKEAVDEAARALGVRRRVTVAVSPLTHGPVLGGILRPVILLPERVTEEFSRQQVRFIVAHELAHIRRLDNLVLLVQRLAEMLLFFHPVMWLCGWAMRREAEAACDDAVLAAYGESAEYADSLTRVAEMRDSLTRRLLLNTFAADESHLARRVSRVLRGSARPMTVGLTVAAISALIVVACVGLPTAAPRKPKPSGAAATERHEEKQTMTAEGETFGHGFRHDPMDWVENDRTLPGAMVRTFVFERPREGDSEVLQKRIDEILARQRADGSFGDTSKETGAQLVYLLELGIDTSRPEVKRAVEAILRQKRAGRNADEWFEKEGCMSTYALHALCLLGVADEPEVPFSLRWLVEHPEEYIGFDKGCPWTPAVFLKAMWAGREIEQTESAVASGLEWFRDNMNDAGCIGWKDPWGATDCAGYADHPVGREIVINQIPLILRSQNSDGGWGENSLTVFRALARYGLVEPLRAAPALPADWRIARSIPAPPGDLFTMAWDGGRLWLYDRETGEAIAVSRQDGAVVKRLKLAVDNVRGIGWWDGTLAVTRQDPEQAAWRENAEARTLLRVAPETGAAVGEFPLTGMHNVWAVTKLGEDLIVADGFLNAVGVFKAADPGQSRIDGLGSPGPICVAADGGGIWHTDWLISNVLFRSGLGGKLLDWGTQPFEGEVKGLAWDGEQLWALDATNRRICAIERTSLPEISRPAGGVASTAEDADGAGVVRDELAELAQKPFADDLGSEFTYQAGVPTAYVQALNHAGTEIDFAEFTALSGWAFSFGYKYGDVSPAYMAIRGNPGADNPYTAFQIADWLGYEYEAAPTRDKDGLWEFVRRHIDSGTPIISEHLDGGLFVSYREKDGKREVRFEGEPVRGWTDIDDLQPFEVCVLVRKGAPLPRKELYLKALQRAVRYASPHEWKGVPQGLAALEAYAADVADAAKDFEGCGDYFSWAAFERLMARKCCAVWLRRAAEVLEDGSLGSAAERYERAYNLYRQYRATVVRENWRTAEGIREADALLQRAINEERSALTEMATALADMGVETPAAARGASARGVATAGQRRIREDLFALFWPLSNERKTEWGRLIGSQQELTATLKAKSTDYGCRWEDLDGSIVWRDADGNAQALFCFVPEAWDLDAVRGVYAQIRQTGSPLAYPFVRQPGSPTGEYTYDIFRLSAVSYLEHCNHFWGYKGEPVDVPMPRPDLFGLFDGMDDRTEDEWADTFASPAPEAARRLGAMAANFDCTQSTTGNLIQWLDDDGSVQAMFAMIPDPGDLDAVCAVYDAIADTGCPLTFAIVHQAKDGEGCYDIFRLSTRSYMRHYNRVTGAPPAERAERSSGVAKGDAPVTAKLRHEGGKVWIDGMEELRWPPRRESSTFMSLAIALQTIGEDVSYEHLMGVSGLAFRMQVHESGLCPSSPHACCGFDALGSALAALDHDLVQHNYMDPEHGLNKDDPADVKRTREAVVASIDKGWPVMFGSEEHGLVVGYEDGGETLLVRSYFDRDKPGFGPMKDWPWGFGVLAKKDRSPDRKDSIVRSLKLVIQLANAEESGAYASGFAAFEKWIGILQLTGEEFEAEAERHTDGIVLGNAFIYVCLMDARFQAAGYLRSVANEFNDETQEHLSAAAGLYDRILEKLREGHKNAPWPWILKDKPWTPQMRGAEAETLTEVLALERQAIAEIEKALAAEDIEVTSAAAGRSREPETHGEEREMGANVRREGGKVWIEGLPTLGWGKDRECTFAGALESALAATGHPCTYSDIMGLTGLAFRVRWFHGDIGQRWCPSSPVGELPEETTAIQRATGWRLRQEWRMEEDEPHMEQFVPDVVAAIDAGMPVLTYEPGLNVDVIYGYEDSGKTLLLRDYFKGEEPLSLPAEKLGPMLIFLSDHAEPQPRRDALIEALKIAVRNWRRGHMASEKGKYWYGDAALAAWAEDLGRVDELTEEERGLLFFVGNWNFGSMADARMTAVSFLRDGAEVLEGDASEALKRAAGLYQEELDLFGQAVGEKNAFLGPWTGKSISDWSPEVRKREAEILSRARKIEAAAIAQIEKALEVEGVELPMAAEPTISPTALREEATGTATEDATVIEGIERLKWRQGMDCSMIGALTVALHRLGEDLTYTDLMGASGACYRIAFCEPWDFSSADGQVAYPHLQPGVESTGYDYEFRHVPFRDDEAMAQTKRDVARSIDQGRPVVAIDLATAAEWGVITGYADDGETWLCRTYYDETDAYTKADHRPWLFLFLGDKGEAPGRKEALLKSLSIAVEETAIPSFRNYANGFAAYEKWANDLLDEARFSQAEKAQVENMVDVNEWCYLALRDARRTAAEYLKPNADVLEGPGAEHVANAADLFEQIAAKLEEGREHVPMWWGKEQHDEWTPEMRHAQAKVLKEVLALERQAIAEIQKALVAEGVGVPSVAANAERANVVERETPSDGGGRVVLEGVPRVRYMKDGMCPFALCLKSCMDYLGKDYAYAHILGVSGACFRMSWNFKEWDEGNMDLGRLGAEPFRRGVQGVGYRPRFLVKASWWPEAAGGDVQVLGDGDEVEALLRESIIRSIGGGMPVLAFGVVGPPEVSIVTGYDDGGDVLVGWSCFQGDLPEDQYEADGAFRKRDWFANTQGIIVLEGQLSESDTGQVRQGALEWAYRMATHPRTRSHLHGPAAYEGWAEGMRDDASFPADDQGTLQSRRYTVWDGLIMLAERGRAADFLEEEAKRSPDAAEHLLNAARAFKQESEYVSRMNEVLGGPSLPFDRLADPAARRQVADLILEARNKDVEAAGHMRRALEAMGVNVPEVGPETKATGATAAASGAKMLEGLKFERWLISYLGCVEGCLNYLDRDVSRAWLYGGTAHAFFINIHEDVDVEAVTAWDRRPLMDLAPNLGFRIEGFVVSKDEAGDAYPARQREAWDFVRSGVEGGRPCFGWELKAPYGDYWVITGYDDVGYHYSGWETGGPTPWQKLGDQFIPFLEVRSVELCEAAPDDVVVRDALAAALRHAGPSWDESAAQDAHFGPEAYDAWVHSLESGAALINHHAYNAAAWHECRQMAVEFLEEAKRRLPGRCDEAFGEAITHYSTVRDRLNAVSDMHPMPTSGWENESKLQSTTAAALVREAGAAEREGLEALKKIVAALGGPSADSWPTAPPASPAYNAPGGNRPMAANVKREDGKVWIEGMENVDWGGSFFRRQDSQVACLTELLRCAGQDVTYADVMGLSGAAFKLTMAPNLFVAEIHSEMGMDWTETMSRVWGVDYDSQAISMDDEKNPNWRERLHQAAVESIQRGTPLFYMNGEWNLLVGYLEDGSAFICKPYAGGDKGYKEMEKPSGFLGDAWFASVLRPGSGPADRRESVVGSLQAAAELARRPAEKGGQRLYGFGAYEAWITALAEGRDDASKHGNAFSYSQLLTSRAAAAEYLRKVADELGDEAAPHLTAAADRYERISRRLWEGRDCVKQPWDESWTAENRAIEARVMRENLADEREAVAEIEMALAAAD